MSTHAAIAEGPVVADTRLSRPYAPSWLDLLVGWIERLPGPTWLAYLAISGAAVAFIAIEAVLSSRGLPGQDPTYFAYAFFHVYPLAAYHYLSRGAIGAWNQFRPAALMDDATAARWQLELTTTPRRPVAVLWLLSAASTALLYTLMPEGWDLVGQSPTFVALRYVS